MSKKLASIVGCVFFVALVGCAAMMNQMSGDPVGNWDVRVARVSKTPSGSRCVARCKQQDSVCFQRLQEPGMNGNAQEAEQCYELMYQCYLSCPDSSENVKSYKQVHMTEALNAACKEGQPEGVGLACMSRNGVTGQAFDM